MVGGAIFWNAKGESAKLEINDCQILNNSASDSGGGLYLQGSNMTVYASLGVTTEALEIRKYSK